jgi:hypothetical protein
MKSSTESLIKALRVLAQDIESKEGVIEAVLIESADRLLRYHSALEFIDSHRDVSDPNLLADVAKEELK